MIFDQERHALIVKWLCPEWVWFAEVHWVVALKFCACKYTSNPLFKILDLPPVPLCIQWKVPPYCGHPWNSRKCPNFLVRCPHFRSPFIKALLKAPQGSHAITYNFQLDAVVIYLCLYNASSNNQTHDTCIQRLIKKEKKSQDLEDFPPKSWDIFFPDQYLRTSLYTSVIGLIISGLSRFIHVSLSA